MLVKMNETPADYELKYVLRSSNQRAHNVDNVLD